MQREITLFNTHGRTDEVFTPIEPGRVRLYTCGPTVYHYAHIGNLRTYIFEDILRRTLERAGYDVTHVMNVTDVGHLTSDEDTGEDKMLSGARREGRSVWDIARFYEAAFFEDLKKLHIVTPHVVSRATEHIADMIAFIERILANGAGYIAGGNVYFSVDNYPQYPELANLDVRNLKAGHRVDVDVNKRNPHDFVLWFTDSKFNDQEMKWDSPWGVGFPGWHIECTAMATRYLGEQIDIHCGGVDHISVHHTNERAQAEAAIGHQWVNYWLHGEFLVMGNGDKMGKSDPNGFLTLAELERLGFTPADYRYFCLGAHYRSALQFHWEALDGARNALQTLKNRFLDWQEDDDDTTGDPAVVERYREDFLDAMFHDLNTAQALAVLWTVVRDERLTPSDKRLLLLDFDLVLGLGVHEWRRNKLPAELQTLVVARDEARRSRDYARADALRKLLMEAGVEIRDTQTGTRWNYHGA